MGEAGSERARPDPGRRNRYTACCLAAGGSFPRQVVGRPKTETNKRPIDRHTLGFVLDQVAAYYSSRAQAWQDAGHQREAAADLNRAAELDPDTVTDTGSGGSTGGSEHPDPPGHFLVGTWHGSVNVGYATMEMVTTISADGRWVSHLKSTGQNGIVVEMEENGTCTLTDREVTFTSPSGTVVRQYQQKGDAVFFQFPEIGTWIDFHRVSR